MVYRLCRVQRLPAELADGTVYLSEEYGLAVLNCACGCGHRVTLLVDDGHTVKDIDSRVDIWPSIGVWDAACRSHFWIRNGSLYWADPYSEAEIQSAMQRQVRWHAAGGRARASWHRRFVDWVRNIFGN